MRPAFFAMLAAVFAVSGAHAAETVAAPSLPAPDAWNGRQQAMVRVLDKLDATTTVLTLTPGQPVQFKTLTLTVKRCLSRPDGLPRDAAIWLDLQDKRPDVPAFSGWLFAAEPAVAMFENPIYGVTAIGCGGEVTQVYPGHQPVPPPEAPASPPAASSPGAAAAPPLPDNAAPAGSSPGGDAVPGIPDPNAPDQPPAQTPGASSTP